MRRLWLASVCVVAVASGSSPARAVTPQDGWRLTVVRQAEGERCPSDARIQQGVTARLGRDVWHAQGKGRVDVRVSRAGRTLKAVVDVVRPDGTRLGRRTLVEKPGHCTALLDAAALTISIVFDPMAAFRPAPVLPDPEPATPEVTPAPVPLPPVVEPAPEPVAPPPVVTQPPQPQPAREPPPLLAWPDAPPPQPQPAPEPQPTPPVSRPAPTSPTPSPPQPAPSSTDETSPERPSNTATLSSSSASVQLRPLLAAPARWAGGAWQWLPRLRLAVHGGASVNLFNAPHPTVGGVAGVGLSWGNVLGLAELRAELPGTLTRDDATVGTRLTMLGLGACVRVWVMHGCGVALGGARHVSGNGTGFVTARAVTLPYVAVGPRLGWALPGLNKSHNLVLELDAWVVPLLTRLRDGGTGTLLWAQPPLTVVVSLGNRIWLP